MNSSVSPGKKNNTARPAACGCEPGAAMLKAVAQPKRYATHAPAKVLIAHLRRTFQLQLHRPVLVDCVGRADTGIQTVAVVRNGLRLTGVGDGAIEPSLCAAGFTEQ